MSLSRASLTAFSSGLRSFAGVVQAPAEGRAFSATSSVVTDDSARGDFSSLYATWFGGVVRWTSALGVRSSDKYDVAQNVFVIVHRRLPDCDHRNIAGWLYRITARQVRDYRVVSVGTRVTSKDTKRSRTICRLTIQHPPCPWRPAKLTGSCRTSSPGCMPQQGRRSSFSSFMASPAKRSRRFTKYRPTRSGRDSSGRARAWCLNWPNGAR